MKKDRLEFLRRLVSVPSPSGFERPAQEVVKRRIGTRAEVRYDVHGNLIAAVNPRAKKRVMLAGHVDEIGLMVTHIDKEGFLYFAGIGGYDPVVLAGQRVVVHGKKGPVPGVIGRKPIHLMESDERGKGPKMSDLWIDIGARDRKDAEKAVAVSDPVTVDVSFTVLRGNVVTARGFDDRVGAFVVAEVVRECAARADKLNVAVFGVSTVQEEIGLRGARTSAFGIDPHAGIAVDVGFSSDCPGVDAKRVGEVSLGKGPILHRGANINPVLGGMLVKAAEERGIPYQMQAEPRATGTDANAIQVTRSGVAAALVSIPNRYMHTPVECVSLDDLDNTIALITATIFAMKKNVDFIPR